MKYSNTKKAPERSEGKGEQVNVTTKTKYQITVVRETNLVKPKLTWGDMREAKVKVLKAKKEEATIKVRPYKWFGQGSNCQFKVFRELL